MDNLLIASCMFQSVDVISVILSKTENSFIINYKYGILRWNSTIWVI